MIPLLPCPFCGVTPAMRCESASEDGCIYQVDCENEDCSIQTIGLGSFDERVAAEAWNNRFGTKDPVPEEANQALVELAKAAWLSYLHPQVTLIRETIANLCEKIELYKDLLQRTNDNFDRSIAASNKLTQMLARKSQQLISLQKAAMVVLAETNSQSEYPTNGPVSRQVLFDACGGSTCELCGGSGFDDENVTDCPSCGGTGKINMYEEA